jgi:hypothetical protein
MIGTALGRRPGVSAATGALLGTLGLWAGGVVAVCLAFRNATFGERDAARSRRLSPGHGPPSPSSCFKSPGGVVPQYGPA